MTERRNYRCYEMSEEMFLMSVYAPGENVLKMYINHRLMLYLKVSKPLIEIKNEENRHVQLHHFQIGLQGMIKINLNCM